MKSKLIVGVVLTASLLFGHGTALAEDIDLFVQPAPASATGLPNVLIVLDNTGNWNTAFNNEKAALVNTFNALPLDAFNVGIMMFGAPDVGYVRAAIRPMDAVNRPLYSAMINSFDVSDDRAAPRTLGRTMSEVHRYLNGLQTADAVATLTSPFNVARDYTGNVAGSPQTDAVHARPGNALNSALATVYNNPISAESCGRTYVIYIGNTVPSGNVVSDNSARNSAAGSDLAAAGGSLAQIPLAIRFHQDNVADEWARFLNESMGIKFYTVDVDPTPMPGGHSRGMSNSMLLASMANVSSGRYFRVNSQVGGGAEIEEALNTIFSEIQAVNSVFASVSLPVSVNTQGFFLNQVYVGMFRPDADAMPRWAGNLKQYKLGIVSGQLRTLDADDDDAINTSTGFITECARSFWTPNVQDTYWAFRPQGGCLAEPGSNSSNFPDGAIVEKGGQAYRLRLSTTRTVKTCSPAFASCTALTDFNDGNLAITEGLLGAVSPAERTALINWQRGQDLNDEDTDTVTSAEMRPSAHGDVLHSRPAVINYGPLANPDVVVFYGGNDGVLRGVNGNRANDVGTFGAGNELWSFVAPEFYGNIKRLRDNTIPISFTGSPAPPPDRESKPYGFDGPIAAYTDASNKWIFASMRRGGRVLYSFDVTNMISTPGSATLKWKIGCPNQGDDTGCTSGFDGMGQTWSTPMNLKTNGYPTIGLPQPMLMMGGGYDSCEDADPITAACEASSKGSAVYVLDANDGSLLKTFTTNRPVAADVFIVPDGTTGLAKFAYVADLGGNLYRISGASENLPFDDTDPINWTITKIASLGCDSAGDVAGDAGCAMNRKFLSSPDVVEKDGVYFILIGSGDREKPLQAFAAAYQVDNMFFMVKDNPADPLWLEDGVIGLSSLVQIANDGADPDPADLAAMKGWALDLRDHEQAVTSAITVFGTTTFSTHTPTVPVAFSCTSNLGTARVYNVRFSNAAASNGTTNRDEEISGGGLPPSPVAGMVELDNGDIVPFIIGADGDSPLQGSLPNPPTSGTQPKSLTYWLIEQ